MFLAMKQTMTLALKNSRAIRVSSGALFFYPLISKRFFLDALADFC
jgi:hypothetical protein